MNKAIERNFISCKTENDLLVIILRVFSWFKIFTKRHKEEHSKERVSELVTESLSGVDC